ncbi:Protein anoxia up-regulated-like [Caenorhabditis elegans]|uniref:Protein anoxia up-regulated-like n=1 Tax=Caenorhabditis elegans TaxID=6239 RepID=G5EFR2_CAEEL|nr:Protein anoxia up-regulated-like [Caenorhabditis elegans]CAB01128.3 Protein anoxia up-regulated-like [Caenorhabditis elegans]|eukprot:NP_506364.2 Uncharacterized protein CELE_C50B8.5 [Caenorhabditis elegans]
MGADEEIQNIYYSIYNINLTLVNLDQGLGQLVDGMNFGLGVFDQHVNMVVRQVNDVQNNVNSKLTLFPSEWLYLLVLMLIVLILLGLVGYLLYYIVNYILNRHDRYEEYRMWYLKNVMKQDDVDWEEDDEFAEGFYSLSDDTPPPTYSEYVQTADLYANYHDEVEAQRKSNQFSSRVGRPRGTGDEYSTLI